MPFGRTKSGEIKTNDLEQCALTIYQSGIDFNQLRTAFVELNITPVDSDIIVNWGNLIEQMKMSELGKPHHNGTVCIFQLFFTTLEQFIYQKMQQILSSANAKRVILELYIQLLELLARNEMLLFICYLESDLAYLTASETFQSFNFEPVLKMVMMNKFLQPYQALYFTCNNYTELLFRAIIAANTNLSGPSPNLERQFENYLAQTGPDIQGLKKSLRLLTVMMARHDPDLKDNSQVKIFLANQVLHLFGYHQEATNDLPFGQEQLSRLAHIQLNNAAATLKEISQFFETDAVKTWPTHRERIKARLHQY